jgi:cytochrome b561
MERANGAAAVIRNDERRWGAVAQALHWLMAAMVIVMLGLGWYMNDLPRGPHQLQMYRLHASLGLTVLALIVIRLGWRLANRRPAYPAHMRPWERKAAKTTHFLLYALLLIQPAIGYLQVNAANFPLVVWGVLPLPSLLAPNEPLAETLFGFHGFIANILGALVLLHIAAALRHHFWLKDDVLRRMLPGTRLTAEEGARRRSA